MTNKPNFFIIGAPKCGTTSMFVTLRNHPEIFMPDQKELQFFATDLFSKNYITEKQYLKLFNSVKDEKIIGEASVWYLYSKDAPANIKKFNKNSKFLIILRNPANMLASLHSQFMFDNMEQFSDFQLALDMEDERKRGKLIKSTVSNRKLLFYSDIAKYLEQIKRYIDLFGEEKVKILIFEKLLENQEKHINSISDFLEISRFELPSIQRLNKRKKVGSSILQALINPPNNIKDVMRTYIPFGLRRRTLEFLISINSIDSHEKLISKNLTSQIRNYYFHEIKELERISQTDLSCWSES